MQRHPPADTLFLYWSLPITFLLILWLALLPRIYLRRRARELLRDHPDAEQTQILMAYESLFKTRRRAQLNSRIAQMETEGWVLADKVERKLRGDWAPKGEVSLSFIRIRDRNQLR